MFGHDDDQNESNNMPASTNLSAPADPLGNDTNVASDMGGGAGAFEPTPIPDPGPGAPAAPIIAPEPLSAVPEPVQPVGDVLSPARGTNNDDLMSIKQQALQQLSPLMSHLDQTPEERFRTTMMMIQASDNDGLIRNAYDAALAIPDEKARAQALLDVVNEINYFTQHDANTTTAPAA